MPKTAAGATSKQEEIVPLKVLEGGSQASGKKRGRPTGSKNKEKEQAVGVPVEPKRRGRPKGSKSASKESAGKKKAIASSTPKPSTKKKTVQKPTKPAAAAKSTKVANASTVRKQVKPRRTDPVYDMLWDHNRKAVDLVLQEFESGTHVLVVQPTGSGKTGVTFGAVEQLGDRARRVMIVQPYTTIEKGHKQSPFWRDQWDTQVRYMTYSRLSKLATAGHAAMKEAGLLDLDLVVFDEVHHINASVWSQGYHRLVEHNPTCLVLGLTATPIRYLDNNFDVAAEYFDNRMVETITLHDAIREGVFQPPVYISDYLDRTEIIEGYRNRIRASSYPEGYKKMLYATIDDLERSWMSKLSHADKIKVALAQYGGEVKNPKFIVFAPTVDKLKGYQPVVKSWFDQIGYKGKVRQYEVYSGHASKDAKIFEQFSQPHGMGVDLLFAVDKLNEGVHLEGVTGLIMMRGTASPIVFYQQLGRVFHAGMKNRPIVFDFVNNHGVIKDVKSALVDEKEVGVSVALASASVRQGADLTGTEYSSVTIYSDLTDLSRVEQQLSVRLLEQHSLWLQGSWDEQCRAFASFVAAAGRLPHKRDHGGVYGWFRDQVARSRAGTLTPVERESLAAAGLTFG